MYENYLWRHHQARCICVRKRCSDVETSKFYLFMWALDGLSGLGGLGGFFAKLLHFSPDLCGLHAALLLHGNKVRLLPRMRFIKFQDEVDFAHFA